MSNAELFEFWPPPQTECPEAAAFRAWISETFAEILAKPTSADLDRVMLRISQEYNLRRKGLRGRRKRQLQTVWEDHFDRLWEQQRSLSQLYIFEQQRGAGAMPALYLEDDEE